MAPRLETGYQPRREGIRAIVRPLTGCSNHWGYEPQFEEYKLDFFQNIPVLYTEDGKWREMCVAHLTREGAE